MRTASRAYREIVEGPDQVQAEDQEAIVHSMAAATNNDLIDWFKWDSIGAACVPQCGECKCGRCPPGGKQMTLGEERDLEKIKGCLTYVQADKQWTQHSSTRRDVLGGSLSGKLHTVSKSMRWYQGELQLNSPKRNLITGRDRGATLAIL